MDPWLSIEIFDGEFPASSWRRAHGDNLTEAAVTNGVLRWKWHEHRWGVVIELEFTDEENRDRFCELPAVLAALDAVPDPVNGLLVYPGRGGGSGARLPRRPRPLPMAGAAARPEPCEEQYVRLTGSDPVRLMRSTNSSCRSASNPTASMCGTKKPSNVMPAYHPVLVWM